ncbi:hypothetical protein H4W26_001730 [Nesterenkonia halotolerans]|uniref:Uncharacterized protein n=1 Tax=Nesterenkonia halotolerans TaxID=225325 RepID=A0ABR9J7U3_9MICC|nr:hypothetical protein [Nesterenkonia halotolerans]
MRCKPHGALAAQGEVTKAFHVKLQLTTRRV